MNVDRLAALVSIAVALGSALVQCNDLGEFKGNTVSNLAAQRRELDQVQQKQAESQEVSRRLSAIETQMALANERIEFIKDEIRKERRR